MAIQAVLQFLRIRKIDYDKCSLRAIEIFLYFTSNMRNEAFIAMRCKISSG